MTCSNSAVAQTTAQPVAIVSKKITTREALDAYDTESETWQKAMGRRFTDPSQLVGILNNVEVVGPEVMDFFDFRLSPYLVQLMDRDDPNCPIRLQYMPTKRESVVKDYEIGDSLGEDDSIHGEGSSVVHRYPNRVLFLVQNTCLAYCRYCTRKRLVSNTERTIKRDMIDEGINYIKNHPEVQDVLLSGGDPLILPDAKLDEILGRIRAECPHVKFLRIGSRLPVQMPTRITQELCDVLERHDVQMLNIHINHPKEITPLLAQRLKMVRKAGVMLGNQTVLLRGVNDDIQTLRDLFMGCVEIGVRPMYVYSNDNAVGNAQFTVPHRRFLELYHGIRGHISGPATPVFIVDGIGGLGKMPVQPEYVKIHENGEVWGTNYAGKTARQINLEEKVEEQNFHPDGSFRM